MIPLYTQEQLETASSTDKLPCKCYSCGLTFYVKKSNIKQELKQKRNRVRFCSQDCNNAFNNKSQKLKVNCDNCGFEFLKKPSQIKKTKKHFCSLSCSCTFHNTHKTIGARRSKLEIWLEQQLSDLYPKIEIHYNRKDAIGSELDIYIPSLSLAFELNGIFHYEPIYGKNKLNRIQENDESKSKACHKAKIDLCVIDVSGLKYFKEDNAKKYLEIIIGIISERISSV